MNLVAKDKVKVNENGTFIANKLNARSSGCTVMKNKENDEISKSIRIHIDIAKSNVCNHEFKTMMNNMI